ncbi:MAG TPA: LOG family protein [Terriglobia bacterium]|nr:LOG family protein [Terriglobia bacterium]
MPEALLKKTITIFGSSLPREGNAIYADALRLGRRLAEYGFVVCNGGYGGFMEATARGAREADGHTVGVTCSIWSSRPNRWIVEEIRTESFSQRLMRLIERGDAYVVLPGGTGTLAELALAWEMMNKSSLSQVVGGRKPLLVMSPYWKSVIDCLEQEAHLADFSLASTTAAMEIIDLIDDMDSVADVLRTRLA